MQDITIRNASLADAPRILEIYAWYVEHTVITFEYDVPSLDEFEGRMRRTMQKYPYLVIERDDSPCKLLDVLLVRHADALLLVHDQQAEILELHILAEQSVRAKRNTRSLPMRSTSF